uniref:Uncharacterized protein n=1 Tax=Lotus japonicus TaxID=34305 RepID=I3SV37_LOTJA|nr:unknown [Lotus japonicus]
MFRSADAIVSPKSRLCLTASRCCCTRGSIQLFSTCPLFPEREWWPNRSSDDCRW